ncbi:MAG TPA: mechanosensitive ion channel family protein [Casimicrobiaceae bacterium]|nr:mechanosensitive ion channel family protein [Casimicrobiaceae bacterium]
MPLLTEDTLRDALVYTGVAIALALLSMLAPQERRRGPVTMAAVAVVALGALWALWRFGGRLESRTLHEILREATLAVLAVGVMRTVLLFAARVLLARFAIPSIVTDVLLGLGLIAYALVRLNAVGVNIAGIVTTSAVITGAIAFSAQEVLGALWAGIALQADRTLRIGDWIRSDGRIGQVVAIRWRTTTIRTRNNEHIVIPNAQLVKDKVLVAARLGAAEHTLREVPFHVAYDHPPSEVVAAVEAGLHRAEITNVAREPATQCICVRFDEGRVAYMVLYPIVDMGRARETDSWMLAHVFAALQRASIRIPLPQRQVHLVQEAPDDVARREVDEREAALGALELFESLTPVERRVLAGELRPRLYVDGDVLFRKGEPADSLFVLAWGRVRVLDEDAAGTRKELAALDAPGYVGEMGLLTGQPRAATVVAAGEAKCFRLDKAGFDAILRNRPQIVEELSHALARRQAENDATLQALSAAERAAGEHGRARDLVQRIRQFFKLSPGPARR